jgi:hypothetical protein
MPRTVLLSMPIVGYDIILLRVLHRYLLFSLVFVWARQKLRLVSIFSAGSGFGPRKWGVILDRALISLTDNDQ